MKKLGRKKIPHLFLIWISPIGMVVMIAYYVFLIIGPGNQPPVIQDIRLSQEPVLVGEAITVRAFATDPDGDQLLFFWGASCGRIQQDESHGPEVTYFAPDLPDIDIITVTVYDPKDESDRDFHIVTIKEAERLRSP